MGFSDTQFGSCPKSGRKKLPFMPSSLDISQTMQRERGTRTTLFLHRSADVVWLVVLKEMCSAILPPSPKTLFCSQTSISDHQKLYVVYIYLSINVYTYIHAYMHIYVCTYINIYIPPPAPVRCTHTHKHTHPLSLAGDASPGPAVGMDQEGRDGAGTCAFVGAGGERGEKG